MRKQLSSKLFIILFVCNLLSLLPRQEILSTHVPFESDEWMRLEVSRLTQCTRIFPLEPTGDGKIGDKTEEEDKEEQEENDEENDEKQEKRKLEKAAKSATYEEIIIQVLVNIEIIFTLPHLMTLRCFYRIVDKPCDCDAHYLTEQNRRVKFRIIFCLLWMHRLLGDRHYPLWLVHFSISFSF